ncbi:hypothetical protein D3C71_1404520 [compost metagenome]
MEAGHVIGDLAVPAQGAVVDQQTGHGAGEGLGQRCQAEHGMGIHRLRIADVGHAVTARGQDAAVLHDGHRHAGHTVAIGQLFGQRLDGGDIEFGGQRLHLVGPQRGAIGHRLRGRLRRRVFQIHRQGAGRCGGGQAYLGRRLRGR